MTPERLITPPPHRRRSRLKRLLSYMFLPALGFALIAMIVILALGASVLSRIQGDLNQLRAVQTRTCQATNTARAESNRDLRTPLKRAVTLAAGGSKHQRASEQARTSSELRTLEAIRGAEKDAGVRTVITLLIDALHGNPKVADAYAELAAQIKTVALLNCATGRPAT